jgi:hypothetical protein
VQLDRVRRAADYCSDILTNGWQEAVAEQATDYVTEATWNRLFRGRRGKRCKALAKIAAAILAGKEKTHDIIRLAVGSFLSFTGADKPAQAFAGELASKIPLPTDVKFIAVARAVQVTGVLLCVANGNDVGGS